ncbi:MAG: hypothetical protein ABI664_07840 [bacterium]
MTYTLWSRGRLIGETELEFVRCAPGVRMGWFHPSAVGERVMQIAIALPPAMQAYVARARQIKGDATVVQAELDCSTEGADLSAALHHAEALEFQLHREDGSVVQTEDIGIIDTHRLTALAREIVDVEDAEDWSDVGDLLLESCMTDAPLEEDIDPDEAAIDDLLAESDGFREWAIGHLDEALFPRYQIQVAFVDDAATT